MNEYDEIPSSVESGTIEYWKARARQSEKRSKRSEREKTAIILELNEARAELARVRADRGTFARAVRSGDIAPVGRDYAPRMPRGWRD